MLENIFIHNISSIVENHQKIFAHEKGKISKETLEEHSDLTLYFMNKFIKEKGLENIILNNIRELSADEEIISDEIQYFIFEMFINAAYLDRKSVV